MLDVVLAKRRDEEVRVVVVVVVSNLDTVDAGILDGLFEVLWKQLPLLIEVVASALKSSVKESRTHSH